MQGPEPQAAQSVYCLSVPTVTAQPGTLASMPEERAQQLQRFEKVAHGQGVEILTQPCFFFFSIYFYYLAAPGLTCSMQDLELQHLGSNSLSRDSPWAPCMGSTES